MVQVKKEMPMMMPWPIQSMAPTFTISRALVPRKPASSVTLWEYRGSKRMKNRATIWSMDHR